MDASSVQNSAPCGAAALIEILKAKATLFVREARGKLSTYIGLLIASSAEIRDQWPDIISGLPDWRWITWTEHHAFTLLGLLVVYARVRRALSSAA
jgi:hypothetical protein